MLFLYSNTFAYSLYFRWTRKWMSSRTQRMRHAHAVFAEFMHYAWSGTRLLIRYHRSGACGVVWCVVTAFVCVHIKLNYTLVCGMLSSHRYNLDVWRQSFHPSFRINMIIWWYNILNFITFVFVSFKSITQILWILRIYISIYVCISSFDLLLLSFNYIYSCIVFEVHRLRVNFDFAFIALCQACGLYILSTCANTPCVKHMQAFRNNIYIGVQCSMYSTMLAECGNIEGQMDRCRCHTNYSASTHDKSANILMVETSIVARSKIEPSIIFKRCSSKARGSIERKWWERKITIHRFSNFASYSHLSCNFATNFVASRGRSIEWVRALCFRSFM